MTTYFDSRKKAKPRVLPLKIGSNIEHSTFTLETATHLVRESPHTHTTLVSYQHAGRP